MSLAYRPTGIMEIVGQLDALRLFGEVLCKSGMMPQSVNTAEKALVIILKGQELGLEPMAALAGIVVIQGKATISPQLMLSLINRSGQLENIDVETGVQGAIVTMKRRGRSPFTSRFGPTEARAMGLDSKENYKKQAPVMYQWRAVAGCARVVFPDVIDGLYTPEEMGAEVQVDEDGAMTVSVQQEAKPARTADVTREVAQAAGVQAQTDRDGDPELLHQWRVRLKDTCEKLRVYEGGKAAAIAELKNYRWESSVGHSKAAYEGLKRIGTELKAAQAEAETQELIQPNQATLPLDIDEPVEAEIVGEGKITSAQRGTLMGHIKRTGIPNTSEARAAFYFWFADTEFSAPTRTNDLTSDQAQTLIDTFAGMDADEMTATGEQFAREVKL